MWQYFLWGGIFVAALVIEGLTLQLMSIWFSVGALAALISSFFDVPVALAMGYICSRFAHTLPGDPSADPQVEPYPHHPHQRRQRHRNGGDRQGGDQHP